MEEITFTQEQVNEAIEKALKKEREEVKANRIINGIYNLDEIYDNKEVVKTKNILASDYKFKELVPAIELIGFEAVNEIIINKHQEEQTVIIDEDPFE